MRAERPRGCRAAGGCTGAWSRTIRNYLRQSGRRSKQEIKGRLAVGPRANQLINSRRLALEFAEFLVSETSNHFFSIGSVLFFYRLAHEKTPALSLRSLPRPLGK